MNTRLTVFLLMTALILASLNDLFADVINVPDDFETIQAAVNNTGEGDTVLVEPGEYNEQVRLPGRNIVLTSFRLIEDDEDFIARTIINAANFNGSAVRMAEGTDERTVLDGFSIINGRTDYGGGVYIAEAGPTLRFLNVANNTATQVGGGIYATRNSTANISHSTIINNNGFIGGGIVIVNGAQITITDCLIQGNSTDEHGGGVHCTSQSEVSLLDVIVRENTSTLLGAGVHVNRGSTMNLNRVQIIDNRGDTGGGIALRAGSEFNAIDVDVIGNFSNGPGGGIYSEESFSTMTNCNFLGNSCPNQGGGQFFMGGTSVQTRCVIADNECSRVAAVYNLWADLSYRNCTIANNRGEEIGEIHSVQGEINLLNSIIWNENNSIITTSNNDEETIIVSYCDITGGRDGLVVDEQDNINWGEGNIDEDPLFAGIEELDYHPTEDSPCIDTGDPEAEPDPDGTRADMGAIYFHQEEDEFPHRFDVPDEYETIQAAIEEAEDGDIVLVAPGEYIENIDFLGKEITVTSHIFFDNNSDFIEQTIIDGNEESCVVVFRNLEGRNSVLRGFTIQNGVQNYGGGIDCQHGTSPLLCDLIVTQNEARFHGGGIYCTGRCNPLIERTLINRNHADCGGGFSISWDGHAELCDVRILENTSESGGSGIHNYGTARYTLNRVLISANAPHTPVAIFGDGQESSVFRNVTIAGNRSESTDCILNWGGDLNLLNCILIGDGGDLLVGGSEDRRNTINISYCNIDGGNENIIARERVTINYSEETCIDEDPLFVDAENGDYHLTEDSPCIDVGDPDAEPDPDDTRRDMGAYYFHQENNNPELQHFVDVQETDVSHLILVEEVQFDDEPVADGWEIGVFTRDDVLSGAVVWGDGGAELIAYGDNQETEDVEGFYPDEYLLSFRAWNPETDMVHRFGFDVDVGGWEWNNEDETTVSLWSNPEIVEQRIELNEHWNMISLNIRPSRQFYVRFGNDEFPDVVCMTLQFWDGPERHHHILLKNGLGHFYVPAWGFHQIPGWMPDEGYQILMDTDMTGTWWGTQIAPEEEIALREGWGIYAYYPGYELDASAPDFYVLSNIIENVELAKDEDGSFIATEFNFSNMPPWRAGEGYQIKTTQECVLVYPEQRDEELNASENTLIRHWHQPAPTGNNMSILVDLKDVVSQNSEIAAFTESGQLVGCGVVNENGQCGLAVWGDDTATDEVDGLLDGEAFVLMCWEDRTRQETDLRVTDIINGEGLNFGIDGFTTLTCSPISGLPTDMEILSISPNPFNSSTSINYSIPAMDRIKISIFDINGRLIETLVNETLSAGIYNVVWDASMVSAGVYLLSIKDSAGKPSRIRKLVMIR
jgi:predicted outer membrane repeat protein